MTAKLTLVDEIEPPQPKGPTKLQKAGKVVGKGLALATKKTGQAMKTGVFWGIATVSSAVLGMSTLVYKFDQQEQKEAAEQNAKFEVFHKYVQDGLKADGYENPKGTVYLKVPDSPVEWYEKDAQVDFPDHFKKAAVYTAERHDSIFDFTIVQQVISKGGYEETRLYEKNFVGMKKTYKGFDKDKQVQNNVRK